jgi:hypothetical protein
MYIAISVRRNGMWNRRLINHGATESTEKYLGEHEGHEGHKGLKTRMQMYGQFINVGASKLHLRFLCVLRVHPIDFSVFPCLRGE